VPSDRVLRSAGLVVAAVAVAAGVIGAVLHGVNAADAAGDGSPTYWLMSLCAAVAYGGTGALLVRAQPRHAVAWVLLGVATSLGGTLLASQWGVYALETRPGTPAGAAALWVGSWLWVPGFLAIPTLLVLLLPDGRLPGPRWRPVGWVVAAAMVEQTVTWALTPYDAQDAPIDVGSATNPVGTDLATGGAVVAVGAVLVGAALVGGLAALPVRWRSAAPGSEQRARLKWVLLGAALTVVGLAVGFLVPTSSGAVQGLAMLPLPAGCLLAAWRHGMWDVDLVINRSLVYGALTAVVVGVYVAVVGVLGGLAGSRAGAPVVATAVVAVLAQPLHLRLQRAVNRLVHGDVRDPYAALARLGEELGAAKDPAVVGEQVLPSVVAAVARVLRVPYAALELRDGSTVASGAPVGKATVRVPLTYAGDGVGELVVAERPGGLARSERRLLADLSRQAAVAVHGLLLGRDLQRSRELLVSAREEERRRLHRELHDGVGPTLASAALQVETARELVATDPAAATAILDRAGGRLRTAVDDVRAVVHGLRPQPLDDLGLAGALTELGARFAGPERTVTTEVADLPETSAAVDVAAYLVAAEALTNSVRHGSPSRVEVVLAPAEGGLVLRVADDGRGVPAQPRPGVGLRSMRERAEELGGRLVTGPGLGGRGTMVEMWLPMEAT
jgi:signal transduction histidine kinase